VLWPFFWPLPLNKKRVEAPIAKKKHEKVSQIRSKSNSNPGRAGKLRGVEFLSLERERGFAIVSDLMTDSGVAGMKN